MKTLIVYYSRTGKTKQAAEDLGKQLGADLEEIVDLKDRSGALGYLAGGKDATLKKLTEIQLGKAQVDQYDLVIVGTPVWAFTMAPAVRSWLTQNAKAIKQVAMFCTMGGSGADRTFRDMEGLCGKKPLASLSMIDKDIKAGLHTPALEQFAKKILEAGK
jgi:flavodoxin